MLGEHLLVRAAVVGDDGDAPVEDDVEVALVVALAVQHITGSGGTPVAVSGEPLDLFAAQPRVGAMQIRCLHGHGLRRGGRACNPWSASSAEGRCFKSSPRRLVERWVALDASSAPTSRPVPAAVATLSAREREILVGLAGAAPTVSSPTT